jgi:hypothetical protein
MKTPKRIEQCVVSAACVYTPCMPPKQRFRDTALGVSDTRPREVEMEPGAAAPGFSLRRRDAAAVRR